MRTSQEPLAAFSSEAPLPSVSVVVPTRDRPEELARAVRAVLGQSYEGDIECLVVFDQSPPVLPAVAPAAAARWRREVRTIVNRRAPGLAGARNSGILEANGELVAFCDDDDEWLPDKLRLQVATLREVPSASVVASGIQVVYEDRTRPRVPRTETITLEQLLRSRVMEIHPSTILAKREEVLEGVGLVDEEIPGSYGEDYEWLLRSARRGAILAVKQPLVRVHWHESSWFAGRWKTIIQAIRYLLEKYPEFEREPRGLARLYGRMAFAHAASGEKHLARRWATRSLRLNWREQRAYLALAVTFGVLSPQTILRLAHRMGRGI